MFSIQGCQYIIHSRVDRGRSSAYKYGPEYSMHKQEIDLLELRYVWFTQLLQCPNFVLVSIQAMPRHILTVISGEYIQLYGVRRNLHLYFYIQLNDRDRSTHHISSPGRIPGQSLDSRGREGMSVMFSFAYLYITYCTPVLLLYLLLYIVKLVPSK